MLARVRHYAFSGRRRLRRQRGVSGDFMNLESRDLPVQSFEGAHRDRSECACVLGAPALYCVILNNILIVNFSIIYISFVPFRYTIDFITSVIDSLIL